VSIFAGRDGIFRRSGVGREITAPVDSDRAKG